jgi:hypothetical protein
MDSKILNIIHGNTKLIDSLIDRVIELEKKVKNLETQHTNYCLNSGIMECICKNKGKGDSKIL